MEPAITFITWLAVSLLMGWGVPPLIYHSDLSLLKCLALGVIGGVLGGFLFFVLTGGSYPVSEASIIFVMLGACIATRLYEHGRRRKLKVREA